MLFRLSKNWAIYTGISFLSCLATILPVTRFGIFILIVSYFLYGLANMRIVQTEIEKKGIAKDNQATKWALTYSTPEFIFLAIAIVVGIYLGVHH